MTEETIDELTGIDGIIEERTAAGNLPELLEEVYKLEDEWKKSWNEYEKEKLNLRMRKKGVTTSTVSAKREVQRNMKKAWDKAIDKLEQAIKLIKKKYGRAQRKQFSSLTNEVKRLRCLVKTS